MAFFFFFRRSGILVFYRGEIELPLSTKVRSKDFRGGPHNQVMLF